MTKIFTLTKRNTFVATAVCAFAYLLLAQSAVIARNAIDQQSETAKKTQPVNRSSQLLMAPAFVTSTTVKVATQSF